MNTPNATILNYPNVSEERDFSDVDNFLIALYLRETKGWNLTTCMRNVGYYMIEVLDSIYTVDENQGILTVGRDNFLITSL